MKKAKGPRYWNGKRWIGGTAAQLHMINTVNDGWEDHHMKFAEGVRDLLTIMGNEVEKPKLKLVSKK